MLLPSLFAAVLLASVPAGTDYGALLETSQARRAPREAVAGDDDLLAELASLRERVEQLEAAAERGPASPPLADANQGVLQAGYCGRPGGRCTCGRCRSRYPTIDWSGFIQFDAGFASQDETSMQTVGDVQSAYGLRRVRLRAEGNIRRDISYVVDLDYAAAGHPSFRDVKLIAHDQGVFDTIQLGYYQQPFGFAALTSGQELLLLERQLPFAFAPFRQIGGGATAVSRNRRFTWSGSGFRFPTDSFGVSEGDNGGWAYANRVTALPVYQNNDRLFHLGGSYAFINPGTDEVRYAIEPGFFVADPGDGATVVPAFVDTGFIPTENINLFGVEIAAQYGSLNLQSEAVASLVDQTDGPYLGFSAISFKLSYVLTGEVHPYNHTRGVFQRIVPYESTSVCDPFSGAWELVAAWSGIDLNDQNIEGGRMQTLIFGVNRYLSEHVKLQLNMIRALLDDPDTGNSASTFAAMRAQVEF